MGREDVDVAGSLRARLVLTEELGSLVHRLAEIDGERESILARRSELVWQLKESGARVSEIQALLGVSRGRVQQILEVARRS